MKITGFRPLIITKDPESVIKTFEDLGFERRHTKKDIEGGANVGFVMKDANDNRVVVASADNMPQDLTGISMNVDNFQEAYDFFIGKGFINPRGEGRVTDTSSSRATMLVAPSGFAVTIAEHLKNRE
ncbi:MAG: hypothetical protein IJ088_06220 [Clostridia bacterium]|nr:hypothetical protein [Clostridia bacterium]